MDKMKIEIDNDLGKWLEDILPQLVEAKPKSCAIIALSPDGVRTSYFKAGLEDLAIMRHNMGLDIMWGFFENNAARLKSLIDDADEEDDAE